MQRFVIFWSIFFLHSPVFAQDDFNQAYRAYQDAEAQQDKPAILKHALSAYELGQKKFGERSENTRNLALNLAHAHVLNSQFQEAFDIFSRLYQATDEYSVEALALVVEKLHLAKEVFKSTRADRRRQHDLVKSGFRIIAKLRKQINPTVVDLTYEFALVAYNKIYDRVLHRDIQTLMSDLETDLIAQEPNDTRIQDVRFILGRMYLDREKYARAEAKFKEIVAHFKQQNDVSNPYSVASHGLLVQLYQKTEKYEQATEHSVALGQITPWQENVEPIPIYREQVEDYPKELKRKRIPGFVKIEFTISEIGEVIEATVIESSHRAFNKMSLDTVKKWRYAPRFVDGKAVRSEGHIVTINFVVG